MKKQIKLFFVLIGCALLFAPSLFSQNPWFAVQNSKIKMAKGPQFVTTLKKHNELLQKDSQTPVHYNAFVTDNNQVMLVAPINSFADLDKMSQNMQTNNQLVGKEIIQQLNESIESQSASIVMLRNDLSLFPPEGTDLSDKRFIRWTSLYFQPKDGAKVMALAKKTKAYWEKQNTGSFHYIYQPVFGSELNRIIVVHRGKSLADIAAMNALEVTHQKNKEYLAILQEFALVITDIKKEYGWYRPDLSMLPE